MGAEGSRVVLLGSGVEVSRGAESSGEQHRYFARFSGCSQ